MCSAQFGSRREAPIHPFLSMIGYFQCGKKARDLSIIICLLEWQIQAKFVQKTSTSFTWQIYVFFINRNLIKDFSKK